MAALPATADRSRSRLVRPDLHCQRNSPATLLHSSVGWNFLRLPTVLFPRLVCPGYSACATARPDSLRRVSLPTCQWCVLLSLRIRLALCLHSSSQPPEDVNLCAAVAERLLLLTPLRLFLVVTSNGFSQWQGVAWRTMRQQGPGPVQSGPMLILDVRDRVLFLSNPHHMS